MKNYNGDAMATALEHNPNQPGKFEGEEMATVYFYELESMGDGPELEFENPQESVFQVEPDERELLGLTQPYYGLHYREDGFVFGQEISALEFAALKLQAEQEGEQD